MLACCPMKFFRPFACVPCMPANWATPNGTVGCPISGLTSCVHECYALCCHFAPCLCGCGRRTVPACSFFVERSACAVFFFGKEANLAYNHCGRPSLRCLQLAQGRSPCLFMPRRRDRNRPSPCWLPSCRPRVYPW